MSPFLFDVFANPFFLTFYVSCNTRPKNCMRKSVSNFSFIFMGLHSLL